MNIMVTYDVTEWRVGRGAILSLHALIKSIIKFSRDYMIVLSNYDNFKSGGKYDVRIETLSALLAICDVIGDSAHKRAVMWSYDGFFDISWC